MGKIENDVWLDSLYADVDAFKLKVRNKLLEIRVIIGELDIKLNQVEILTKKDKGK